LIIIVLSVVNWPDRLTGRKEKETDPKYFARGFYQDMIMTVNCRFLKPLDFSSRERRAVLRRWFSAVYDAPHLLPQSFELS
jgi:hypothetical protein